MKENSTFLGIDGEGQTVDGRHLYTSLAYSSADGWLKKHVEAPEGEALTTAQCLDFICSAPKGSRLFAYSFGYDITKILESWTKTKFGPGKLYSLVRPDQRKIGAFGYRPIAYLFSTSPPYTGFLVNYFNGQLSVRKQLGCVESPFRPEDGIGPGRPRGKWGPTHTIRDIWRFYQGPFTSALTNWKVGDPETVKFIAEMKERRAEFNSLPRYQVLQYCFQECRYMAELAERLVDAHERAEIPLKQFYGAGSSAGAMLKRMGIGDHIKRSRIENPLPPEVEEAARCAFFGGRFETSVVGIVTEVLQAYDISSAYPYQICFLPCLIHGKWHHTKSQKKGLGSGKVAIIQYGLGPPPARHNFTRWGPFPLRLETGCIIYPKQSRGGWVWRDEYLAGNRLFPNLKFRSAWVYECDCNCRPFEQIPHFYRERLRIGKEGPGIVLKLGMNSCAGKAMQTRGGVGQFQSWVWGGLITSGTRAQDLDALGQHEDWDNLLYIATDGIITRETLQLPKPKDTGTWECPDDKGKVARKPLGGWEQKPATTKPFFFARPGVAFPLDPTEEEIAECKARGMGRKFLYKHWKTIVSAWKRGEKEVSLEGLSRFIGVKDAVYCTPSGEHRVSEKYGQWLTRHQKLNFEARPKRFSTLANGRLTLWKVDIESLPYDAARVITDAETLAMQEQREIWNWQPDPDFMEDVE